MNSYDQDFVLWTEQQAALLRQGRFGEADLGHIAEEIESMGKSDRRALKNHLINVVVHLLKWRCQRKRRGRSWESSIINGRREIGWILEDSPSLRPQLPVLFEDVYGEARRQACRETRLSLANFPEECPFSVEQALDADYWPE
ncbi:MAG: DUF29 domain-containing protein [Candidatus Competibacter sp.]|nr:DUF29 domain-containing protein [Candidatus Competibacter sp.]